MTTNHAQAAAEIIGGITREIHDAGATTSAATLRADIAQTHALLAIADQLRIANLIELILDDPLEDGHRARRALFDASKDGWPLRPEIAALLGIGAGHE